MKEFWVPYVLIIAGFLCCAFTDDAMSILVILAGFCWFAYCYWLNNARADQADEYKASERD